MESENGVTMPQIDLTKTFSDAFFQLSLSMQLIIGCSIGILVFFKLRDFFAGSGGSPSEDQLERLRARRDAAHITGNQKELWKADRAFRNARREYNRGGSSGGRRRGRGGW